MIFKNAGKIIEGLYLVGPPAMPIYLLDGQDAKNYFPKSMAHCRDFLNLVETSLIEEGGDVPKVIARIKAVEYDPVPEPKQIEPAYLLNLEAKVKAIKKRLG